MSRISSSSLSRKIKPVKIILSALLIWTAVSANLSFPQHAAAKKVAAPHSHSELLVKFKDNSKKTSVKSATKSKLKLDKLNVKKTYHRTQAELWELGEKDDLDQIITELSSNPNVEYVQPNYELTVSSIDDPLYPEQWGLRNAGQKVDRITGVLGVDIGVEAAWNITSGAPTTIVGILDTGIDISHPDLSNNIFHNTNEIPDNNIDDDGNGLVDDVTGWDFANGDNNVFDGTTEDEHGTHVAGVIGASANSAGIRGVATDIKLLSLKFISGGKGYTSDAIEAIEYAKQMGVRIINASFGGPDANQALKDEIAASDILFVSAAGNNGQDLMGNPVYPAAFGLPNVLAVGAVNNQGELASFSNYGLDVDVAAPGVGILGTVPNNGYEKKSGTSIAAAFITGIAALVQSQFPDMSAKQLAARIKGTVTADSALTGQIASGGIGNALSAIGGTIPSDPEPTVEPPETDPPSNSDGVGIITTLAASVSPQLLEQIHYGEQGINVASGNFSETFTNSLVPSPGFTVSISHSYNSKDTRVGPLGTGWTFGFEGSVKDDVTAPTQFKTVKLPSGTTQVFVKNSDGTFTANDSHSTLVKKADSTFTLLTSDQTTYTFDTNGYMTSMTDRNGNKVTIAVDASGKPTQVTDSVGRIYSLAYNTASRLTTVTDAVGRQTSFGYDASNRLVSVTDALGNIVTRYEYDASGYLTKIKDGAQNVLESIVYDHSGTTPTHKVSSYTSPFGMVYTYAYDTANSKTTITDSNGRVIVKWNDAQLFTTKSQDPEGKQVIVNYTKDANGINKYGEQNDITDRNGNKTVYQWDGNGNMKLIINPDNSTRVFTYDAKNNTTSEKDEAGKTTFYLFDSNMNNLLQQVQPLNGTDVYNALTSDPGAFAITSYAYYSDSEAAQLGFGGKGLLKSATDPEGNTTSYTYDAYGNTNTITDASQNVTKRQYNSIGWLTSSWSPNGFRTDYSYDANGRIEKVTNQQGETTRLLYDVQGRKIQEISPNQYQAPYDGLNKSSLTHDYSDAAAGIKYAYYPTGKLKSVTDALGNLTQYTYDSYGNSTVQTLPNASQWKTHYDSMNRKDSVTFVNSAASGGASELTESAAYTVLTGGLLQKTTTRYFASDTDKADTVQTYDYAGRLITVKRPDGISMSNTYNLNGTLASSTDANGGRTYYKYDGMNRLTDKWSPVTASTFTYTGYTYDRTGNKLTESVSKDKVALYSIPATDRLITHKYLYQSGRLVQDVNVLGGLTSYQYDRDGNIVNKQVQANANNTIATDFTYNQSGKILSSTLHVQAGSLSGYPLDSDQDTELTTSYKYDNNGNLVAATTPEQRQISYTYDLLNRQTGTKALVSDETGLPVMASTSSTYDWAGHVLTQTDANGHTASYSYTDKGLLKTSTAPMGGTTAYAYDRAGRKVTEVSPENYDSSKSLNTLNRSEYTYDTLDRLKTKMEKYNEKAFQLNLSWTTAWVERVTKAYLYDNNGNIVKEVDGEGYKSGTGSTVDGKIQTGYGTEYRYNMANQLTGLVDAENKKAGISVSTTFEYDGAGRKISVTDAYGAVSGSILDDSGNVLSAFIRKNSSAPVQVYKTNSYDMLGHVLTSSDAEGRTARYTYNSLGKVTSATVPGDASIPEETVSYQYDVMGNLARKSDSAGVLQTYTYDAGNRATQYTESYLDGKDAVSSTVRYDKAGNKRFETDGNGTTTETLYNNNNLPQVKRVQVQDVNGGTQLQATNYAYDKNGNQTSVTDWLGNAVQYRYDALGRLIETIDPNNVSTQKLVYNASDKQILSFDSVNNMTQYQYDQDNRLTYTINPEGYSTRQAYNYNGQVGDAYDGRGNKTHYDYDAFGQLVAVGNAKGETTSYTYNLNGKLLTARDGNGNATSYEYNARNLLLRKIDPGGRSGEPGDYSYESTKVEEYSYTSDGLLETKKDRNGNLFRYDYDAHGRILSRDAEAKDHSEVVPIQFTYDNDGNRLSMSDSTGTSQYRYDELGRQITASLPSLGTSTILFDQTSGATAGYSYNVTTDVKGNTTKRTYDKTNRLYQVQVGAEAPTTYTYYNTGAQKDVTYPNGVKESFTYDRNNRLTTMSNTIAGTVKDQFTYSYDAADNMVSKNETIQGTLKGTTSYTYDALNRLQSVTEPTGKLSSYQYDGASNRTMQRVQLNLAVTQTDYLYNEQNRLTTTTETKPDGSKSISSYMYDPNGNLIQKALEQTKKVDPSNLPKPSFGMFVYGQANTDSRIAAIVDGSAQYEYDVWNQLVSSKTGSGTTQYTYNGDGLRRSKTLNGDTTTYVYENSQVALELDGQGNQVARNVRGINLISRKTKTDQVYYTYNGHADVIGLVDSAGKLRASYDYDAFGNPDSTRTKYYDASGNELAAGAAGRINSPFRYAGYVFDEDTQLYYLNARYYDANVARFTSEDTYGGSQRDPLSLNRYTYVHNEPIMYTDKSGHWEESDKNLNAAAQAKLIAITSAYYNAKTDAERDALHVQAETVRNASTSKQTSTAVLQTTAIQKANTAGDASRGYMTGDEWNKATVDSGIVTKTATVAKITNGQTVVTTSTISQSTLGVVVAATANVATVTVASVSSVTPVSAPVVTQEPAAIDKSRPVQIASLPALDGPGEAAAVSKPTIVEESCKVPPVSEEITTSSNKEDNSNSIGYTDSLSLPNLPGMPDFSWAQNMLDKTVERIGKVYSAVMSGPWYPAYNAASGENLVTGEELSTTQRVIDGVAAALYFIPDLGEMGEATTSIEVESIVVREVEQVTPEIENAISTSIEGAGEVNVPSANTRVINTPEVKAPTAIKASDVTKRWEEFLGDNTTNINPRTGQVDPDRIFSADGTRSVRFSNHEMNSSGTPKYHYHEETWTYDAVNDTMTVTNTLQRIK